ncbi:unnamed protein product, partial [Sphacelaria rigidula]
KIVAARNLQLERLPFRDAYLYQYGLLPEQYVPPREDRQVSIHVCDSVDAKLPESLTQKVARSADLPRSARREVPPWDSTMKNV